MPDALGVPDLRGFGLAHDHSGSGPAGALVNSPTENPCAKPKNLRGLRVYRSTAALLVDPTTLHNLNIFESARDGREGSLFAVSNHTVTAVTG